MPDYHLKVKRMCRDGGPNRDKEKLFIRLENRTGDADNSPGAGQFRLAERMARVLSVSHRVRKL
jgi:hypothetical protein